MLINNLIDISRLDIVYDFVYNDSRQSQNPVIYLFTHGGVKVSTGILGYDKRVELDNLLKGPTLKLNANNRTLALAA